MIKKDCDSMLEIFYGYLDLFQKMTLEDKKSIAQNLQYRTVKEGDILFKEGKIANEIFFVCKGVLKIASVTDKGNEVIHFFSVKTVFVLF
jgi:CRP-like cAMP-binding protein